MRTRPYSDLLNNIAGLVGLPAGFGVTAANARITTEISTTINTLVNGNLRRVWDTLNWTDLCPKGEARFAGNLLTYPNDLSKTANWTATAVTLTANNARNPADYRLTATKMMETGATSAHKVVQTVTFFPSQQYTASFYARPNGRNNIYLAVDDGNTTYTAFFNVQAGTVGTTTNFSSTSIAQAANGFFLCTGTFTSNASAGSGSVTVQCTSDGSTLSYAGDTAKGNYVWGVLLIQNTAISPQAFNIPWAQTGENEIETIFEVWRDNPNNATYPRSQGWLVNPDGVQLISALGWDMGSYSYTNTQNNPANPSYIYYRKAYRYFVGSVFSATATYAVGSQIYYTIATSGATYDTSDYYRCLVATSAGEDPEDTPNSWEKIDLPEIFFDYLVYQTYGDWLIQDGQMDKASGAYAVAKMRLDGELDRQERQMYDIFPMQVNTHVTSQSRY